MDNIQSRVDNWRKKIEEKKGKNEKVSEHEAKIILNANRRRTLISTGFCYRTAPTTSGHTYGYRNKRIHKKERTFRKNL